MRQNATNLNIIIHPFNVPWYETSDGPLFSLSHCQSAIRQFYIWAEYRKIKQEINTLKKQNKKNTKEQGWKP